MTIFKKRIKTKFGDGPLAHSVEPCNRKVLGLLSHSTYE